MDRTQVPPDHMAESNGDLNERWPALPWTAWHDTGETPQARMHIGKRGGFLLVPAMLVMAVLLLVFSGCAAAQNAVSPAPTISGAGGTLVATLMPEGTNTTGTGTAHLQMNPEQQTVCSVIHVSGIQLPATAAHIHRGAAGVNGPIVVPLQAPNAQGYSTGCTHAPRALIVAIMQHPAEYYVNVHNVPFPNGAVRGQLAG
jgi:hypothetical protein